MLFALLFGTTLVVSACGGGGDEGADDSAGNNEETQTEDSAEGTVDTAAAEEAFQQNCASCHGGDLSGGVGPDLTQVGADHSKEDILGIIKNGQGDMPPGQATGDTAELIASWLATKK